MAAQQRRQRGSRRGPQFDFDAFAAQHFPKEHPERVKAAAAQVFARHHRRKPPSAEEVQGRLEELGWTQAQLRGSA